jgi:uncharacterized membrane protein
MIYFILFLSLILRLTSLNQSLWLDEATTALVSRMPVADFFTKFMPADFHPPLYYLVIHYWTVLFGTSEISLRIPSVLFGVATVYIVYLIAKDLKFKYPLVPALFLATSGLHVYYSQEARMYGLVTMLASLLILSFIRNQWKLFSILLSLIFLTDYLAVLIIPALFIYVLLYKREYFKKLFISLIPFALTFIFWLPTFYKQISSGIALKESSSGWWSILGPVTFKNIALIPTKFMIGRITFDDKQIYFGLVALISTIFVYQILKSKNKLIWSWFLASLVLGIILSFFIPTLTYFRYLFILPAFYLLMSENITKRIVYLILTINLLSTSYYLFNSSFHRENWKELAKTIGSEKIVLPSQSQKEALIYYGKEKQIVSVDELKNNSVPQFWLSRYVWEIFDINDSTRLQIEDLGYNKVQEINLNGVVFYKYESSN